MRVDKVIEESDHFAVVRAFSESRKRLRVTRGEAADAAKFRTSGKSLCLQIGGKKHFLEADSHMTARLSADADHFPNFLRSARRGLFYPNVRPRPQAVDSQNGENREMLGIVISNDEHQLGPFPRQHRVMIDISSRGTEKPGAIRRPFRIEITDRHQLYRSKSKRRVDVAISVGTGTDETDPKPARVFVIVDDVRDKRAAPGLFAHDLAIRRGEDNEEQRFRMANVGGAMPDIGQHRDGISRSHFRFSAISHRVADFALDHDQDFAAVGVIVAGVAAPGF